MVKYLSALKRKKGFTVVELVVVIAIIAVLVGIIAASFTDRDSNKIIEADSNAATFMTAAQLAFTKAQFTERSLVSYQSTDTKYIEYKDGANAMATDKYLFMELYATEQGLQYVHIDYTLTGLAAMDKTKTMTKLEKYFLDRLETGMAEVYNGYFYAQVDSKFRVVCTHFCQNRLPTPVSGDDYRDAITLDGNGKLNNSFIGTAMDATFMGSVGNVLFNAPDSATNATEYVKFFA